MIFIHNYIITFSFIALLLLFIGAYFYYLRQYKEHKKKLVVVNFWFGTNYGRKNID